MIKISAQTLYETVQEVNGPISETGYADLCNRFTNKNRILQNADKY
jgi:hypothetical protein